MGETSKQAVSKVMETRASRMFSGELMASGIIALFGLAFLLSRSVSEVLVGIGALFLGAMLLVRAMQWKQIDVLTQQYVVFLSKHPKSSVHDLAISMKKNPGTVKEDFQLFSKRGLLIDVVIDEQSGEIIIGSDDSNGGRSHLANSELVEVECNGCGARKMIPRGSKDICDHCGNELSE